MGKRFQFTVNHMIGRQEVELLITYSVTPGRDATGPTYACGGEPAEPHEVEIVSIKNGAEEFICLSPGQEERLWEMACERADADLREEAAAEADWRYQEYRDRQLMERWEREA